MRKRVSLLLSIIIFIGVFNGVDLFAAPSDEFLDLHQYTRTQEGIYEKIGTGLEKRALTAGAEEAAFKWKMQQGKYELSYHMISSQNETNKVKLSFDVSADDINLTAELYRLNETIPLPTTRFSQFIHPYTGSPNVTTGPAFEYTLGLNPTTVARRELSFAADNTNIRIFIENNTIHLFTNNIRKGYITDFTLTYAGESQTYSVLNGLRGFEITPTHLIESGGSLVSKEVIEVADGLQPGSAPGVKVAFDKPKKVNAGVFTAITPGSELATLAVWGEQRPGVRDSSLQNNERNFTFKLGDGEAIKDTVSNQEVGSIEIGADGKVNLYISKTPPNTDVIEWGSMEASMLLGAQLRLSGGAFESIGTNNTFKPENNGHTYLKYRVYRASESQICIEITPYNINGTVNYTVKERLGGDTGGDGTAILTRVHNGTDANKNDAIFIYVPQNRADVYYQIETDIGTNYPLKSQQLRFQPSLSIAPPPITQIIRANNIYVIPPDSASQNNTPEAIGFDIEWAAPSSTELEAMLNKGDIYYELSLYDTKKENPEVTKVFKVSKSNVTTGSAIEVEVYGGTADDAYVKGQYNRTTGTFEVSRVVIQNANEMGWERLDLPEEADRFDANDYLDQTILDNSIKNDMNYVVPGIYYLSMKGIFDPTDSSQYLANSKESTLASIALDYAIEVIPSPSKFSNTNQSDMSSTPPRINYDIQLENVDITRYVRNMLEPAKIYLEDPSGSTSNQYKGIYEIFLYQKNANKQNYTETDLENAMKNKTPTELGGALGSILDAAPFLDNLRKGEVIPIKYTVNELSGKAERENISFRNLDPNQVYYIKVRVRLEPLKLIDTTNTLEPLTPRYSIFSSAYSFTTTTVPQPPKPDDKVPPAPEDFWIDSQPNNTTAILKWAKAEFEPDEDMDKVYYEMVRVLDTELKETEHSNKIAMEKLVANNSNITGFDTAQLNIRTIDHASTTSGMYELLPIQPSDSFRLEDVNLSPNTIYYYYIRTVCIIDGERVRSEWLMVPVTTQPVEKPIRLQVETPQKYSYDSKTETVISFLAPIPEDAEIPGEYEFEIAIQSEMDSEYKLNYKTVRLTSKEDTGLIPSGYRHFVYRIEDLKPGKRYDIKVRIVDKTKDKPANGEYPRSLYSDKVVARTEFDEDDQEIDNKFDEYLKKYDDEVEKLRRKPYWEGEGENKYSIVYKYRESYISAEMAVQNVYELQTDEEMNRVTYYLPANMLDKASDLNVVISAALGNESMSLRPYTLTTDNEAIKEAVQQLDSKKIEDYYIKIEFTKMASSAKVNGEEVISPEILIDMDIVYLEEEDIIIEDDIMIELNELIDRERKDVIKQLEKELDKGTISDDRLEDIIADAVSDIKADHKKEVKSILKDETDKTVSVNEIEKSILIVSVLDSYSVNGYYLEGSWTSVEVLQANGGFAIEAQKLGVYVFTGKSGLNTTVPSLSAQQDIISKYNLTDFFVLDAYMIKTAASKNQVYGAVARILGAKRNVDYMEFLKLRGIKGITAIGVDKSIRQDEAVYIIMQAYEKIYNKPIAAINIKNRQSVTNIGAFQPPHRQYVYAAVELKIIPNTNGTVMPSKMMSAEEIIKMLSSVVPK